MNDERKIDEAFLTEMMKRGEKAWKDVPDATAWVEELRNGTLDMTQNKMNDTPTPRTDALMPTQENGRTLYDHVQIMEIHARQLERELAEVTKQRDHYKAACDQYSEDEMLCKLQEVTKQRDEWKANHDNQVAINRTLRDRPDLGERAKLVDALTKQRDALAEACSAIEHAYLGGSDSEWGNALMDIRQALAATKGGKP